tara:strand:- start:6238 stop:6711 length:474 start_codon:yes stop_codon:yes gene_type:complete
MGPIWLMAERKGLTPSSNNKDLDCLTSQNTDIESKRELNLLSNPEPCVGYLEEKYTLRYISNPYTHIDPFDTFIDLETITQIIAESDEAHGDCDLEEDDAPEEDDVLEQDYSIERYGHEWSNDPELSQDSHEWLYGDRLKPSQKYLDASKQWLGEKK